MYVSNQNVIQIWKNVPSFEKKLVFKKIASPDVEIYQVLNFWIKSKQLYKTYLYYWNCQFFIYIKTDADNNPSNNSRLNLFIYIKYQSLSKFCIYVYGIKIEKYNLFKNFVIESQECWSENIIKMWNKNKPTKLKQFAKFVKIYTENKLFVVFKKNSK